MWLDECTPEDEMILVAIAALAGQLSRPFVEYAEPLLQLNRRYFRRVRKLGDHNPSGPSLARPRDVRVTERWQ